MSPSSTNPGFSLLLNSTVQYVIKPYRVSICFDFSIQPFPPNLYMTNSLIQKSIYHPDHNQSSSLDRRLPDIFLAKEWGIPLLKTVWRLPKPLQSFWDLGSTWWCHHLYSFPPQLSVEAKRKSHWRFQLSTIHLCLLCFSTGIGSHFPCHPQV